MEPGGGSVPLDAEGGLGLKLDRRGIWEIRPPGQLPDNPPALAVNVDVAESDLTRLDVEAFQAAVGGAAALADGSAASPGAVGETEEAAGEDYEKSQAFWRYLLAAAFLLMASETMLSNRLSREAIKEGDHVKDRQPAT